MSTTPNDRPGQRRAAAPANSVEPASAFHRRIECDGTPAEAHGPPARGGGLREPDAWERRRETRR